MWIYGEMGPTWFFISYFIFYLNLIYLLVYHIFENTQLKCQPTCPIPLSALGQYFMGYFWEKHQVNFHQSPPSSHCCTGGGFKISDSASIFPRWTMSELTCIHPWPTLKISLYKYKLCFQMTKSTWGP